MNILNWLITSSADPKKYSLAIKGAVMLVGAQIIQAASLACGLGLYCLGVDQNMLNQFAGIAETMVFAVLTLIGAIATLAGLLRKFKFGRWSAAQ